MEPRTLRPRNYPIMIYLEVGRRRKLSAMRSFQLPKPKNISWIGFETTFFTLWSISSLEMEITLSSNLKKSSFLHSTFFSERMFHIVEISGHGKGAHVPTKR